MNHWQCKHVITGLVSDQIVVFAAECSREPAIAASRKTAFASTPAADCREDKPRADEEASVPVSSME